MRWSWGAFGGLGARAIAPVALSPSAGLALGVAYHQAHFSRQLDAGISDDLSQTVTWLAPAAMVDAAIRIAFLRVGFTARVELGGERETDADPSRTTKFLGRYYALPTPADPLTSGAVQFFAGPTVGLALGK